MNAQELLNFLYRNNVAIDVDGDDLLIDAPEDFLDDELVALITNQKFQIIEILRRFNKANNLATHLIKHNHTAPYQCRTTLAQERMLFLEELAGSDSYYNLPFAYKVHGTINKQALVKAFTTLIGKHEILRTTYELDSNGYNQFINSEKNITLNEVDLCLAGNQPEKILSILSEDANYRFQLDADWPIRVNLIKLSAVEHIISINLHHIAADGLSARRILNDISNAYDEFLNNPDDKNISSNDEYQYSDYAIWQRNWLDSADYHESKNYWLNSLSSAPHVHSIPTDFIRPSEPSTEGEFYSLEIAHALSQRIINAAQIAKTTPFIFFQTAFAALLSRYSGQEDIVFGIASANRYPSSFINSVGLFVNTLAMRYQLTDNPTFSSLLTQAIDINDSALKHQSFPFDALVDHLQPQRDLRYNALIQIMLVMHDGAVNNLRMQGTEVTPITQKQKVSKFDFSLHITPKQNRFIFEWEYNTDLFQHKTIETISTHFIRLLEALIEEPDTTINSFPLIDHNELPKTINTSIFPPLECVHQLIENNVVLYPDAIAIIDGDRKFSYRQLDDNANIIAAQLLAHNKNIKRVGLSLNKSAEMIFSFFAILKMGAVYVPLDPNYPKERLEFMVNDSAMDVLITGEVSNLPNDLTISISILRLDDLLKNKENQFVSPLCSVESPAYIIYTSGSTGKPKGVLVSHKSLFYSLIANQSLMQISNVDTMPTIGSQAFGVSLLEILLPLISGGTVLVLQKTDILNIDSLTHLTNKVTVLHAVPSLMRIWLDLLVEKGGNHAYPNLRLLLVGGEAVPDKLLKDINIWRPQVRLLELYGMTELAVVCSSYEMANHSAINYCIGRPHPNTEFYVLNEDYQHQPIGVPGELHIGGLSLASEYINQPGITNEKFVVNPFDVTQRIYKSGDRVKRLADGHYEFLGRVDFQVSVRGVRIECGEIETLALQVEGVKQAVAHVFDTQTDNQVLTLYFTLASEKFDHAIIAENIGSHLHQHLPDYMCPSIIQKIDELPLNPNGKVDRKALPAPDMSALQQAVYLAPRTDVERVVCDMWQDILGLEQVGITDNFFQLGGHSLSATRLVARINQTFNVTLPLKTLFATPTVEDLALAISALAKNVTHAILEKISRDQVLLSSFTQQRLWLLDQIDGGSAHYNLTGTLMLSGQLNFVALNKAFNSIIERHESLRTCFSLGNDGQPVQIIQAAMPLLITVTDLSALNEDARDLKKAERIQAQAHCVFDLNADVMLRVELLKIAENEHLLVVTVHHIASDGWSISILINELSALYSAYVQGFDNPLVPLAIQYADYAHWQRNWLQGEVLDTQLGYWKKQLVNVPIMHSLPLDYARPQIQSFAGAIYRSRIDATTNKTLSNLCQTQGATLFMGLHAAFSVLLSRYSNETDIVVGSPIANREQAEIAGLIGFFVNTLVLRSDLSENPSFTNLLNQSKTMLLDAYAHQQVPFEQIVERLQPERNLSHSALFQVMLVLQNNEQGILELPGLTLSPVEQTGTIAKYDLTLTAMETPQGLQLDWEYNTDLFEQQTIAQMANHFGLLLNALLKTPNENVFNVEMLDVQERQQLLVDWSNTQVDYPNDKCIHELFEAQVESNPNAIAVTFENQQLSYEQLNQKANQLAHYLITEKQIKPDTLVGICVERSLEMVVGILAILKAGGAYVPLDPEYPEARLKYMLDDAQLTTVLTQSHLRETTPVSDAQAVCLDDENIQQQLQTQSIQNPNVKELGESGLTSNNLAYVIYTSGSTGNPKGVLVEHQSILNLAFNIQEMGLCGVGQAWGWNASYAFDASLQAITQLMLGSRLQIISEQCRRDPSLLANVLDSLDAIDCTPMMAEAWFAAGIGHQLPNLILGGEPITPKLWSVLVEWQQQYNKKAINVYGPTECTVDSTGCVIEGVLPHIGKALPNTTLYVMNPSGQLVGKGLAGELHIGGVGLARGYLNRADLTAEQFIANPFYDKTNLASSERLYKTGDLVRWLPDGNLEYLGRIDHQVKIRGFRIELGEIENTLSSHAGVMDAVVLAKESPVTGDKRLVAYVVTGQLDNPDENTSKFVEQLRQHLSQTLPDYMVPSAFVLLDSLPLTPNGKVDRKALPEPDFAAQQNVYVAPTTETEKILCEIWQEVLGVERVGLTDNFFQLGGHSLLIMQVIARLQQQDISMTARQLFTTTSLGDLAIALDASGNHGQPLFKAPANLIPDDCQHITPDMLPLVDLSPAEIAHITGQVPGGVANVQDIYPLGPLQEGILFHHMMATQGDAYVLPALFKMDNRKVVTDFIEALQFIINRHDALRTAVFWNGLSVPVQVVCRHAELPVTWLELDASATIEAQMRACCEPGKQWIDLGQAPLLQLQIAVDPDSQQHYVLLQFHHIISDHVGLEIIQKELALYQAGQSDNLPAPTPYREFVAHAQHQALHNNAKDFFSGMLGDVEEPTAPFDVRDVNGDGSRIVEAKAVIPASVSGDVRRIAKDLKVSPAALFHTAWAMVIAACSGRDDVVFGTVLSGRLQGTVGAEHMLGVFINTLPLRVKLQGSSVASAVHQIQDSLLNLLPYEQNSLALAQRCSGLPAGSPLFTAMLNYRHSGGASADGATQDSGMELLVGQERTNYPLTLSVDDFEDAFGLDVQVDQSIGAERVLGYVQMAIAGLAQALSCTPEQPVTALSILPDVERQQLLIDWNSTHVDYPSDKCIHELFEAQVETNPNAIALAFENQTLSYQQLNEKANQLAHYLINEKQVTPDTLVGICVERSLDMVVGILAILKAGGAYVPLDPEYPEARLKYMLDDAQLTTVLTQSHLRETTPVSDAQAVCLDDEKIQQQLQTQSTINPNPSSLGESGLISNHLAYVIYTSGSTGNPKGVMVEHNNVANFLTGMGHKPGIKPEDCLLAVTSTSFDIHGLELFLPLVVGAKLVVASREATGNPELLFGLIEQQHISIMQATPATWKMLLDASWQIESPLKVLCGGEALGLHLATELLNQPQLELWNMYGPTETTIWSTTQQILPQPEQILMGQPIANTQIYLAATRTEKLELAPVGVAGELLIGGAGVTRGYLHRPDLTAEKFIANPFYDKTNPASSERLYKTGDLVRWLPNGHLEFLGRIDHQVKIRGFRIELGEIENALSTHSAVKDAVVIAKESASTGDKRLVAYVVAGQQNNADENTPEFVGQLRQHLHQTLPDYMVPSAFVLLESLPLTPNGKVDRKALPEPDFSAQQHVYVAPTTETEKILCNIWQEVLGVERVGVTDNFFELGGHSLLVTRLVVQINKQFNVDASLKDIFALQTIAEINQYIEDQLKLNAGLSANDPDNYNVSAEAEVWEI